MSRARLACNIIIVGAVVGLAGCSTADLTPLESRADLDATRASVAARLKDERVSDLDLKLYVAPVQVACKEDDAPEDDLRRYGMHVDRERLADEIRYVLDGPFGKVKVHPNARDSLDDAKAAAFEGRYDAILVPRVVKWDAAFVETNACWWPNALFLYWYLYFPSWVIADESFGCRVELRYDLVAVTSDRALPGLKDRAVSVDSKQTRKVEGREEPLGPRVDLDLLDRGIDLLGPWRTGSLDRDQWSDHVQRIVEPHARRWVAQALARDLAAELGKFRALSAEQRASAVAAVHAVVVGVGEDGPNDPCPCADADARAIAAWLTNTPDEAAIGSSAQALAPPRLVRQITGSIATRASVTTALRELADVARPEDTAVFFFAGRGARRAGQGLAALGLELRRAALETDAAHAEGASVLGLDDLKAALAQVRARRKVVVIDASFARGSRGSEHGPNAPLAPADFAKALAELAGPGGAVVAAASPDEPALVFQAAKHGLLTYALVDGLEGAAASEGRAAITWHDLRAYVESTVASLAALDCGQRQRPVFCVTDESQAALGGAAGQ